MMSNEKEECKVKSLAKAMKVLECFTVDKPELGITEIAQMINLPKSTVHNIVSTFCDMGYISFNANTSRYYLGLKLLHFSYIVNTHLQIRNVFLPYLRKIAEQYGETTYIGIPDGSEVLYIESISPQGTNSRNILGERAPLYCTGIGKAMLAYMHDKIKNYPDQLKCFTENTIPSKELLEKDLALTRGRGYSVDNMEHEFGIRCIGVPVFGHDGNVIAAVSISAPSLRLDDKDIERGFLVIQEVLEPIQNKL